MAIAGYADIAFFARYFFPHYCYVDSGWFHRELFRQFRRKILKQGPTKTAIAAPRESAKSTITCFILAMWVLCYADLLGKHYVLITSDTAELAAEHVQNIKEELEGNDDLREVFGEQILPGEPWTGTRIRTQGGFTVSSKGTGGNIRGIKKGARRPDVLIADDLENDENSQTIEQRKKLKRWFFRAFCKAGTRGVDIFAIGTILNSDSLLANLIDAKKSPGFDGQKYQGVIRWSKSALWSRWERLYSDYNKTAEERETAADAFFEAHHKAMTIGTEVLWPQYKDYYTLMKLRFTEGPTSFSQEIQNEPVDPSECLFKSDWFAYFEEEKLLDMGVSFTSIIGSCDPSMGKSEKDCPSAIITLGVTKTGALYVLDASIEWRPPSEIIEDIILLYERRKHDAIGVEDNVFQEFFKNELIRIASERKKYLPVQGITSIKDKDLRIQRLEPMIKNGTIKFQKKHTRLIEQLQYYPNADAKDGPDALEMAVQMVERLVRPDNFKAAEPRISEQVLKKVFG